MGFGTLFIGTLLTMNLAAHGYTDFLAYFLILYGLYGLRAYNRKFKSAFGVSVLLFAVGLAELTFSLLELLEVYQNNSLLQELFILNQIVLYVTTVLILLGVAELAIETDIPSLRVRAFRNQIFAFIYHGCMVFLNISTGSAGVTAVQQTMLFPVMLFGFAYLILQAKVIFSCYMWICPEEDADMPTRPSRISLFNKWRAFDNRIDERTAERKEQARREKEARSRQKQKKKQKK